VSDASRADDADRAEATAPNLEPARLSLEPIGPSLEPVGPSLEPTGDQAFDLDLMASSLQADGGDVRIMLKALVTRLSGALGTRLQVERSGGFLKKRSDEIRRISVQLGEDTLEASVNGGTLECIVFRSSGGIRIRSAKVSMDEWLRTLLGALKDEAANSSAARQALESIVIGDQG